jgi:hypothetical protein
MKNLTRQYLTEKIFYQKNLLYQLLAPTVAPVPKDE